MNISENTLKILCDNETYGMEFLDLSYTEFTPQLDTNYISTLSDKRLSDLVSFLKGKDGYIYVWMKDPRAAFDLNFESVYIKIPSKKEITPEWVYERIEKQTEKANSKDTSSSTLKALMGDVLNLLGVKADATTYGISLGDVWDDRDTDKNKIKKFFTNNGIEYKQLRSFGNFVAQFVVSKSKNNLEKVKNALLSKKESFNLERRIRRLEALIK